MKLLNLEPTIHGEVEHFSKDQVSPGDDLGEDNKRIKLDKLRPGKHSDTLAQEANKETEKNKKYVLVMVGEMIINYQTETNKLGALNRDAVEKMLDAIDDDITLVRMSTKNREIENDDEVNESIDRLSSIKKTIKEHIESSL